jgi:anhydro-N-acetylmuramic acid kinase
MRIFAGLMSGTSVDGIDAVLIVFDEERPVRQLAWAHQPWPDALRGRIQDLMAAGDNELERAGSLHVELGRVYADCVDGLLASAGVEPVDVEAIGCHGQTVRHCPDDRHPFTVQIGSGAVLARRTGIAVVCDFRSADMAAGGQGAPLAPGFHAAVFRDDRENRVILNLGGIANVTFLPIDRSRPVTGFDTGPANTLLDGWAALHLGVPFDADGRWARSGRCDATLLARFITDPYFARQPPKSTGREQFNIKWVRQRLGKEGSVSDAAPEDVQCTLAHLTAHSVAAAIDHHCADADAVYLCGGGARNSYLREILGQAMAGRIVNTTANLGIEPESVEAAAFAWLAKRRLDGLPGNLPTVTGASGPAVLGALYLP